MAIQSSYNRYPNNALAGLIYDLSDHEAYGRSIEASAVPFGAAVVQGTNDNQARIPDSADVLGKGASGLKFRGVVMLEQVRQAQTRPAEPQVADADNCHYVAVTETASIAVAGRIWVRVEVDVSAMDDAFFRHAQSAPTDKLGAWRNDDDGGNAQQVTSARFVTSAVAGELAVLELSTGA